jgi:hypothetical protein
VVGVRVKLNTVKWVEGVFNTVVLLGEEGVNKLKKLKKLKRCSGVLRGLSKVNSRVPSIQKGLYLGDGMVDTFKDKI